MNFKLFNLLSSFSKDDLKQFRLFVDSPYFTSGKNYPLEKIQSLLELVKKHFPKLSVPAASRALSDAAVSVSFPDALSKQNIFTSLYGTKKYNDAVIRNLFSDLTALAEEFLKYKKYSSQNFETEHNLLIELFNRKLDKEFLKQMDNNFSSFNNREISSEYFYDRFRTYDYKAFFKGRTNITNYDEIQLMYNDFNSFYLLRVLQLFILMVNHQSIVSFKFNMPMYDEVMSHIETNQKLYENIPHIEIYYNLILMFVKKDEVYFYKLKELLSAHYSVLNEVDKNNLFVCLGNYCLEQLSKGSPKFNFEKFENDKAYLQSGLLDEKHFINIYLFIGICRNALFINEINWTENLLSEKISRIAPEYKNYTEHFIKAEIFHAKKVYGDALAELSKINIELPYFKQSVRNLTLKIYYELNYFEEAKSVVESSNKFLINELEGGAGIKEDLKLFMKYYLKFLKLKELKISDDLNYDTELRLITNDFNSARHFREKQWLSQKLSELKP